MDNIPLHHPNDTPANQVHSQIRLIAFEDNPNFRESLRLLFKFTEDIHLVEVFPGATEAVQQVQTLLPDVVLMDIDMPGINGIDATARIKEVAPEVQVIMLTVSEEEERIFEALRQGAIGYLLKKSSHTEIIDGVRQVRQGGSPMTPAIARKVLGYFHSRWPDKQSSPPGITPDTERPQEENIFAELTPRELEILEALVDGLSYKLIAARFFISADTVKNHIQGIYRKLHVNSKGEAISIALKKRLNQKKFE
jgi:DNA-binding NarL/FixJ family response regulator